jgi:isoleucyl-tRNA synthetase
MLHIFVTVILLCPFVASAQNDAEQSFEIQKQYRKLRFEDFYTNLEKLEQNEAERQQGASQAKQERKKINDEYERSRAEYVRNRRAKTELDATAWENETKAQRLAHEKARADYVLRRNRMNKEVHSVGEIPETDEYDINVNYEEEQNQE